MPTDGENAYIVAVTSRWNEYRGGALLPADVRLESVVAVDGRAEIIVAYKGLRFRRTVQIPLDAVPDTMEPDAHTPGHWALWDVIVPIVEELQTDAENRTVADGDGVRRI